MSPTGSLCLTGSASIRWLGVVAVMVAWHSPAHAQTCLIDTDKAGTTNREVTMRALPSAPSFYYRADDYVAFIPPQDVMEFLERASRETRDQSLNRVAQMIRSDMPIKANQDLFAYVTRDWSLWSPINFAIIQLISDGKATLTNLRGVPMDRVTIVSEQSQRVRSRAVLIDVKPQARMLWKYECSMG